MKILLQKVLKAQVHIKNNCYSEINKGLLIYFCAEKNDTIDKCKTLAKKCCGIQIFEDNTNKRRLNISDINAEILIVSQFTLAATCNKGNKPDYYRAEKPEQANLLYQQFIKECQQITNTAVKTGLFGENMQIESINDGPMTFILEK